MKTITSLVILVGSMFYNSNTICKAAFKNDSTIENQFASHENAPTNMTIEARFLAETTLFDIKINKRVKRFIGSYLDRGRKSTAKILGRSYVYCPIIEQY